MGYRRHRPLVMVAIAVIGAAAFAGASVAQDRVRPAPAGRPVLEIQGGASIPLSSCSGGNVTADVVEERSGDAAVTRKHLGNPRIEPLVMKAAAIDVLEVMRQCLSGKAQPMDGRVTDVSLQREFAGAVVTELALPQLDGSANDAALVTLSLQPQQVSIKAADAKSAAGRVESRQKALGRNLFKLTIPGLDTSRVARIEPVVFRQPAPAPAAPRGRDGGDRQPAGPLSVGNLTILLAETAARPFFDWHQDFVVKGNNGDSQERTATLELLGADGKPAITLEANGVGIITVRPVSVEPGQPGRVEVQMYVEQWQLK